MQKLRTNPFYCYFHCFYLHVVTRFWIGAKDDVTSHFGGWLWVNSNQGVMGGFTNWAPGFPRNMFTRMPLGTRCGMVSEGQWKDAPCDRLNRYVCEYKDQYVSRSFKTYQC